MGFFELLKAGIALYLGASLVGIVIVVILIGIVIYINYKSPW